MSSRQIYDDGSIGGTFPDIISAPSLVSLVTVLNYGVGGTVPASIFKAPKLANLYVAEFPMPLWVLMTLFSDRALSSMNMSGTLPVPPPGWVSKLDLLYDLAQLNILFKFLTFHYDVLAPFKTILS